MVGVDNHEVANVRARLNPLVGCIQLHGVGTAAVTEEMACWSPPGISQKFGLQEQQAQYGNFPPPCFFVGVFWFWFLRFFFLN